MSFPVSSQVGFNFDSTTNFPIWKYFFSFEHVLIHKFICIWLVELFFQLHYIYFVTPPKDTLTKPNANKEWFKRNTDGHIELATWAEMFDNSLDKKEKEEAEKQLKMAQIPTTRKKPRKCSLREHLIVFLIISICIFLMILLPVFWFLFYEAYTYLWGHGWISSLYTLF